MITLAVVRGCAFALTAAGGITAVPGLIRRGGVPCWQSFGLLALAGPAIAVNGVLSASATGIVLGVVLGCLGSPMALRRRREQQQDRRAQSS